LYGAASLNQNKYHSSQAGVVSSLIKNSSYRIALSTSVMAILFIFISFEKKKKLFQGRSHPSLTSYEFM
jgi:Na+/H+ antiporter NhaA